MPLWVSVCSSGDDKSRLPLQEGPPPGIEAGTVDGERQLLIPFYAPNTMPGTQTGSMQCTAQET